jgi:CHC2 zinc finger
MGLCLLHDDHKPSCLVDPSTNLFYCYGCGRGGDVIRSWLDFCGAGESLEIAKRLLLAQSAPYSSVAHTSMLRAEIELLLAWDKRPNAAGLIEEHFTLWKRNPNVHQLKQLQSIRKACGFIKGYHAGQISITRIPPATSRTLRSRRPSSRSVSRGARHESADS